MRWLRPLAVLALSAGVSVGVASRSLQAAVAAATSGRPGGGVASAGLSGLGEGDGGATASALSGSNALARLELLDNVLFHVEETYVEPSRIDWEVMFEAALRATEANLPPCLFGREPGGRTLSVEIGGFRTVLEVPPVRSRVELVEALRRVASLLATHLDPSEVGVELVGPPTGPGAGGPDPWREVEYIIVNGVLSTLDPHTVLLRPDDATDLEEGNRGEYGGVGLNVIVGADGRLRVESVREGSPALAAGLRAGDEITRVDGEGTLNMDLRDALPRLRGPVGTHVVLEVLREGAPTPLRFEIERAAISSSPVTGQLLEGAVGYVAVATFHDHVQRDVVSELARLEREAGTGLRGLILDLRGNPGGFLTQAVAISDLFLTSGDIVSTVDGNGRKRDLDVARDDGSEPTYPLAVLVSATSASASEIVAGALRNNERAVILGERSFGKGSVQTLQPAFEDGSKLKLTISKYLTPGDRSIQSVGIPADIEIVPVTVARAGVGGPDHDEVRLFERERVRREADLDQHLEVGFVRADPPTWRIHHLVPPDEADATPRPSDDFQVLLARDVLLAAPSSRRAEVLASAGGVVAGVERAESGRLARAFDALGVDWRDGPPAPRRGDEGPVELSLDLGPGGQLVAGTEGPVTLTVTNHGDCPLYRVAAVVRLHPVLDGAEFAFGLLPPGASKSFTRWVTTPPGAPDEDPEAVVEVRDSGEGNLSVVPMGAPVAGRPLPRLGWSWTSTSEGDRDGRVQAGERVHLELEVVNLGEGDGRAPVARLLNRSGTGLDPVRGHASLAAVCETPPCPSPLAPGGVWRPSFEVAVSSTALPGTRLPFQLEVGNDQAWDLVAVGRLGWWKAAWPRVPGALVVGEVFSSATRVEAPIVTISRAPALREVVGRVTLSGVVTDDTGIAHVMVFVGDDKVFHDGVGQSSTLTSVPFSADLELEAGPHEISVLAIDRDGMIGTRSIVTQVDDPALARVLLPQGAKPVAQ